MRMLELILQSALKSKWLALWARGSFSKLNDLSLSSLFYKMLYGYLFDSNRLIGLLWIDDPYDILIDGISEDGEGEASD